MPIRPPEPIRYLVEDPAYDWDSIQTLRKCLDRVAQFKKIKNANQSPYRSSYIADGEGSDCLNFEKELDELDKGLVDLSQQANNAVFSLLAESLNARYFEIARILSLMRLQMERAFKSISNPSDSALSPRLICELSDEQFQDIDFLVKKKQLFLAGDELYRFAFSPDGIVVKVIEEEVAKRAEWPEKPKLKKHVMFLEHKLGLAFVERLLNEVFRVFCDIKERISYDWIPVCCFENGKLLIRSKGGTRSILPSGHENNVRIDHDSYQVKPWQDDSGRWNISVKFRQINFTSIDPQLLKMVEEYIDFFNILSDVESLKKYQYAACRVGIGDRLNSTDSRIRELSQEPSGLLVLSEKAFKEEAFYFVEIGFVENGTLVCLEKYRYKLEEFV